MGFFDNSFTKSRYQLPIQFCHIKIHVDTKLETNSLLAVLRNILGFLFKFILYVDEIFSFR